MKWKQIDQHPRSYVLIFNTGDELAKGLKDFAAEHNLADASFKAIGALASVKLAWFDPETKRYRTSVDLKEQVELLSLIGDVAQHEGKPIVHAHAVVGRPDGATAGGHLLEAFVRPTCEVFLTESPVQLSKALDPESGLVLIKCKCGVGQLSGVKGLMSENVRVAALIEAKQGEESAVQQACEACVGPTRQETGCGLYVLHRDSQNPSLFVLVEDWKSEEALSQHMQRPHFKALTQALDGKLGQPMSVHVLRPV